MTELREMCCERAQAAPGPISRALSRTGVLRVRDLAERPNDAGRALVHHARNAGIPDGLAEVVDAAALEG
jgi:hypothetical protein